MVVGVGWAVAKKNLNPLLLVPGMLFWALILGGIFTKNNTFIGIGVVLAVVSIVVGLTFKGRAAAAERNEKKKLWAEGVDATAKVVTIGTGRGSLNDHPRVLFDLEVNVPGKLPYTVQLEALVSQLAIPRIQPGATIAVKVDKADGQKVLIDTALTPYGY